MDLQQKMKEKISAFFLKNPETKKITIQLNASKVIIVQKLENNNWIHSSVKEVINPDFFENIANAVGITEGKIKKFIEKQANYLQKGTSVLYIEIYPDHKAYLCSSDGTTRLFITLNQFINQ